MDAYTKRCSKQGIMSGLVLVNVEWTWPSLVLLNVVMVYIGFVYYYSAIAAKDFGSGRSWPFPESQLLSKVPIKVICITAQRSLTT